MDPFITVTGVAAPLPSANIDTDVIMPKQFLKGIDRTGLAHGAFHHLRFDASGATRPDFILNRSPWRQARFLVVGPNFGCGSSREHAVWGLRQLGIRAIVGTSFGGIFFDNCTRNGLLAVSVGSADLEELMALVSDPARTTLTIDLNRQTIVGQGAPMVPFTVEPARREALMEGLDMIGATLRYRGEIEDFQRAHLEANPWLA